MSSATAPLGETDRAGSNTTPRTPGSGAGVEVAGQAPDRRRGRPGLRRPPSARVTTITAPSPAGLRERLPGQLRPRGLASADVGGACSARVTSPMPGAKTTIRRGGHQPSADHPPWTAGDGPREPPEHDPTPKVRSGVPCRVAFRAVCHSMLLGVECRMALSVF